MSILKELSQIINPITEGVDKPTCCKVGDTVWAKDPFNKAKTVTGKVKRVGRTSYTLTLKDGSEETYPHKDVSADYDIVNPKTKRKIDEVSTAALGRYKKKAGEDASAKDKEADIAFKDGDLETGKKLTKKADKRFSGIVKATKKQFDNDKSLEEQLLENAELHKLGKQLKGDKEEGATDDVEAEESKPAPYGVEIGQVYVPADGSTGELTVVGLDLEKDDAIVQDSDTGEERNIDLFKLAKVRYKLKDEQAQSEEEPVSDESTAEVPSEESESTEADPKAFAIGDIVIPNAGNHKGERHEITKIKSDGRLVIKPKDLEGEAVKYRNGAIIAKPEDVVLAESYKDAFKGFKLFDKNATLMSQVNIPLNEADKKAEWEEKVKKMHPDLVSKMKFKNRIEQGKDTTSAEIGDRSYGVFDNDKNVGKVFKLDESVKTQKTADHFMSKLSARLKPEGFKRDRDQFKDAQGNSIKVLIDTDENDGWINVALSKKNKEPKKFDLGLDKSEEAIDKILKFALSV